MKKLLAVTLAVLMAATMSVTAFAEGNSEISGEGTSETIVHFNVAPTYIVTIPADITLEETKIGDVVTYESSMNITAANVRLEKDYYIYVTLEKKHNDFKLELTGEYTLPYDVIVDGKSVQDLGGTVAAFDADGSETLTFKAGNPKYAGNYTDTVTFTISVALGLTGGESTDPDAGTSDAGNQNNAQ